MGAPSATGSATGARPIAYLSDHGPASLGPGPDGLGPVPRRRAGPGRGVDLLIHDAQHTAEELPARAAFGHSAADYAVRLGERGRCPAVLLFHHDPTRTDDEVDAIVARFAEAPVQVTGAAKARRIAL